MSCLEGRNPMGDTADPASPPGDDGCRAALAELVAAEMALTHAADGGCKPAHYQRIADAWTAARAALSRSPAPAAPARAADGEACGRCEGDGKAHGSDRPFEWAGPGTYPGPCPACGGSGKKPSPADELAAAVAQVAHQIKEAGRVVKRADCVDMQAWQRGIESALATYRAALSPPADGEASRP